MSFSNLLDDEIISENLEVEVIIQHSKKIAQRVFWLTIFFCIFSFTVMSLTYLVITDPPNRNNQVRILITVSIFAVQFGAIFLTVRLFLYQRSIRSNEDWQSIFETKHKLWRSLAIVLGLTLTSISLVILDAFKFI